MEKEQLEHLAVMTVEFGVTRQPESYQSVRCNVTLPVFVRPGDDIEEIAREKLMFAKQTVRIPGG